jgi:hypothetical protein
VSKPILVLSIFNYQHDKLTDAKLLVLASSLKFNSRQSRITKHNIESYALVTHPRKTLLPNAEERELLRLTKKTKFYMQGTSILPLSLHSIQQMSQSKHSSEAKRMDIEDSNFPSHKYSITTDLAADHRKNKGTKIIHGYEPRAHHFWYGFPIMEAIAATERRTPEATRLQIPDLMELGWLENEALDYHNGKIAFLLVLQHFSLQTRRDKRLGHWYHFTQIPFEIETDPKTGFALVYNILFYFEKPNNSYSSSEIINLIASRLRAMEIELGDIVEPIAPLCGTRGNKTWNGIICIHLKTLAKMALNYLKGNAFLSLSLMKP